MALTSHKPNLFHIEDIRLYLLYGTGPDDPTNMGKRVNKSVNTFLNDY